MDPALDTELMQRAAESGVRAETAFTEIIDRYKNILLNFFLRKNVSYFDSEDLAQQTFLRLWRYRYKYTPQAKFSTFLFMIAQQVAIDFFRAEKRRKDLSLAVEEETKIVEEVSQKKKPAECDRGEIVRQAVAGLSQNLRDVVELGVFQELPYSDVAKILGIPEGTVKSRMFNALKKLKEMFNGNDKL